MKVMNILITMLLSLALHAGTEGGAGGDGVKIGDQLYLIDLVEAGIEANPYFDMQLESDVRLEKVINRLEVPLKVLANKELNKLVAIKLLEISNFNHGLALSLLQCIESYQWILVNHALVNIPDEDSVLELTGGTLKQIAIRGEYRISISRTSWSELDINNKVALIFHEALYAMQIITAESTPDPLNSKEKYYFDKQSSPKTRVLVGTLFQSEKLHLNGIVNGFNRHFDMTKTSNGDYFEVKDAPSKSIGWATASQAYIKAVDYCPKKHESLKRDPGITSASQFHSDLIELMNLSPKCFSFSFEFDYTPNLKMINAHYKNRVRENIFYRAISSDYLLNSLVILGIYYPLNNVLSTITKVIEEYKGLFKNTIPSVFNKAKVPSHI